MSRNGSGVYNLPTNSWNPAVDGNSATTADWQDLIDDVASAITQSVSSDGQTPMTGDLNMNGNTIENLADGVANDDAATVGQLYSQGEETDVASSATTDIGIVNSNFLRITGTTTITSLGINYNGPKFVRFSDALTLTYNATTLILPGGVDITTSAGDTAIFVPKGTPQDGWVCTVYEYAANKVVGDFDVVGDLSVKTGSTEVVRINNNNNTSSAPSIDFASTALLSSAANFWVNIDADASSTDAFFAVAKDTKTTSGTILFVVSEAGDTLVGTTTLGTGLVRVLDSGATCIELTNTETDTTNKSGRVLCSRYTNSEVPFQVIGGISTASISNVQIGGGGGTAAPASQVTFYTATLSGSSGAGTERGSIQSGGNFFMQGVYDSTTASAANVFVRNDGLLQRSTSSERYKKDIEDMDIERAKELVRLFRAVWYRSTCETDNNEWSYFGAIAEEVAKIDPRYVHWGYFPEDYEEHEEDNVIKIRVKEGAQIKPVGLMYERFTVPLMMVSKDYEERLQRLESLMGV